MKGIPDHTLGPVAETLLTPLWARAHAAEVAPGLGFTDPYAVELLERTGFDSERVLRDHTTVAGTINRTLVLDGLVRSFLDRHGDEAVVVSAGVGLCARDRRLAPDGGDAVRWIGVDAAEVIAVRRELVGDDDPSTLVDGSVADADWTDDLPIAGRPTIVVAEGVLMYLDPEGLAGFLAGAARLPAGSEVVADVFHPKVALSDRHPIVKATGARFLSGVRDGAELAGLVAGYELVAEHDVMERIGRSQRLAAKAFRTATRGGRFYHVAQLRVTGTPA